MTEFSWGSGPAQLHFHAPDDGPVRASSSPIAPATPNPTDAGKHGSHPRSMVEVLAAGYGRALTNIRIDRTSLGSALRYVSHDESTGTAADTRTSASVLTVTQRHVDGILEARTRFESYESTSAMRVTTTIANTGDQPLALQTVASLALSGVTSALGPLDRTQLWSAATEWCGESRWEAEPLIGQHRLIDINTAAHGHSARGSVQRTSTSTWSSGIHVPVAALANTATGAAVVWQMENAGPWHWELNAQGAGEDWLTLVLSGPTDLQHGWTKVLAPGEEFTSIPVSLAFSDTSLEDAVASLTAHRRASHLPTVADADKPLIFNDYMNALMGDPTTENEIPLIDAAAAAGAEYYCIDCGWYDDTDDWWPSIGEWKPSTVRFGDLGLPGLLQYIRDAGMKPGLWIEPEHVGVDSPAATFLPEECFMHRLGARIREHERYILDLREPKTREYLDSVFDRLVNEYGARYFKWDYNVTPGSGPDDNASGPGEGLLDHVRALLAWIESLRARFPEVVFEACNSGAQRMDQSIEQRFDLQSTSDEQDYRRYPTIAAAAPMAMTPEMAGNWGYPHGGMTDEQIAFTLVTGLSGRLYLSGHLNTLSADQLAIVRDATAVYHEVIAHQCEAVPQWPLGLPAWDAPVVALATTSATETLVFVWNRQPGTVSLDLPLGTWRGKDMRAETLFPHELPAWDMSWQAQSGTLHVELNDTGESARVIKLTPAH